MLKGRLTTHVLDTTLGGPAVGLALRLYRLDGDDRRLLGTAVTNADGRTDRPLLEGEAFGVGVYEIQFEVGAYHRAAGADIPFLDAVPVRFGISDLEANYHVPLLLSPFGYSTYRGS
ncbi:MAG: hydroxyisourate hydrolase [Alphaproteobacteria bacterium]|nr:hydroxyisourate hydrolase [Alphaproteobacteria bacterium]